jgi:hypothetical protein
MNSLSILNRYIERSRFTQALNTFMGAVDVGGVFLTELMLANDPPEVLIRPDVRGIGLLDNIDPLAVARTGERAAEAALPLLEHAVTRPARLAAGLRRFFRPPCRLPFTTEVI